MSDESVPSGLVSTPNRATTAHTLCPGCLGMRERSIGRCGITEGRPITLDEVRPCRSCQGRGRFPGLVAPV
ncbi:hypothetical protein SAMN04489726_5944 [Allokutzneria albata]|uniref:Uncharacterized protein n=1 Tax=Allokutzneria albata TaxID=211114 RepID=A0A1H0AAM5_ALLAB|nr:hypothetical protein SAMN04489726_5944 [Allokutzneria albata]